MRSNISFLLLLFTLPGCLKAVAQPSHYTVANAHAHNDYQHSIPFSLAYNNGFGSIEADIFTLNGNLYIAHNKEDIVDGRTLNALYLQPLLSELKKNKSRQIRLLIDLKGDYKVTLPILQQQLTPLNHYLRTLEQPGQVTIVISGNQPPPSEFSTYPSFFFFDASHVKGFTLKQWQRVGLVSMPFTRFAKWDGLTPLPASDQQKIRAVIDSVHSAHRTIRFWAAPDTPLSWKTQMQLGADVIGTDKIEELTGFLKE
ncbi:alkaline phosphatase [Pedobacter sp. HMF7647]|uniref:Alkaline phosphatase n=1 Tax=Hufsiella arboris TaxID=2695275 RepID=A0A7K1YDK5_9SPHI|nr:alkaline phosphatase [Hufsiella arboris]MXV52118.1 alkaline phosphatase [Hufsiella arboris]